MWSLIYTLSTHIYPSYASYKALSSTSTTSLAPGAGSGRQAEQVERWLTYWCVVGIWTGLEGGVEWWIRWIPFYGLFKCLFFLWLALPQTEGSTIIYTNIVAPLFAEHEQDIDTFLSGLSSKLGEVLIGGMNWLWGKVREQINLQASPPQSNIYGPHSGGPNAYPYDQGMMHQPPAMGNQPPTLQDPASGVVGGFYSLATRYAMQYLPVAATAVTNAIRPLTNTAVAAHPNDRDLSMPIPIPTPHIGRSSSDSSMSGGYDVPISQAGGRGDDRSSSHVYTSSLPAPNRPERRSVKTSSASSSSNEDGSRVRLSWGVGSGYEEIRREEVDDDQARPGVGIRSSSWFGWGTTNQGKPKSE